MNHITQKQTLYVNSKFKNSGTHSNFTYNLDIDPNKISIFNRVSVLDAIIPKSFYTIDSSNNTFTVEENSIQRTITITPSNYSRKSFRSHLTTLLNTGNEAGYTYTISYDQSTSSGDDGKYTFTVTTVSPQPIFILGNTGPSDALGLELNTSYTFTSDQLKSVNVSNFRQLNRIILSSNICQNYNNNFLQQIISNDNNFEYIIFKNDLIYETYKDFVERTGSNNYYFKLLDEDLNEIDLNGLSISFTLLLWKENNITNLISDYIKMKVYQNKIKDATN